VDRPFNEDATTLENASAINAEERIELFRTTLASTAASDAVKSYDLVWLAHPVGDVHQPLHCTRFSTALPHGDRGGNSVTLSCSGCGPELHGFWDGIFGETSRATLAAAFASTLLAAPSTAVNDSDVGHWVTDSFNLARSTVYVNPPTGVTTGPFSIPAPYESTALDLGKSQVALAGARLGRGPRPCLDRVRVGRHPTTRVRAACRSAAPAPRPIGRGRTNGLARGLLRLINGGAS
jgi:hypothetical protein